MHQGDGMPVSNADVATSKPGAESPDGANKVLVCLNCRRAYRPGELACSHCGVLLAEGVNTTRIANEPTPVPKRAPIGAVFVQEQKPIVFDVDGTLIAIPNTYDLIVGRQSEVPGSLCPDVDLSPYGAAQRGVSRQHVRITRKRDLIYVIDLGSTNGTFLNGRRLVFNQERLLRNGDELRLGRLKLIVKF
jgi:hypothetical protein